MIGQVVDGHHIVRSLGRGGMGEVYLARNASGELRALKVVRADRKTDRQAAGRFRREVVALGKLRHPGIVQMLDAGELPTGELYLAMEYVAGDDLQIHVIDRGPLAVADAIAMLSQVARALAYAHAAGIVHRDLKPPNVILADGDPTRAKIIDFGLAKVYANEKLTRLTEDQQVLGSPLYWAPEQSSSAEVGPAADVYALGGLAYFALTGEPLFRPRPAIALVYAHLHATPETLAARCVGVEVPRALDELVRTCVAKSPAARPSAESLAGELARLLADTPRVARVNRPPRLFQGALDGDEHRAAIANQIRQIAIELASALAHPIDEIDQLQHELSELELELAMVVSEVDVAVDSAVERRHDGIARAVTSLRARLDERSTTLVDEIVAMRASAPADAAPLYDELDSLFRRYRGAP